MQFLNQHTSKYQKCSKHFVCTRFPGSSRVLHWLATRLKVWWMETNDVDASPETEYDLGGSDESRQNYME